MPRERTYSHAALQRMFPAGIPLSVLMIVDRAELEPCAKNRLIDEIVKEHNPPPAVRTKVAMNHVKTVATLARKEALKLAHDIMRDELKKVTSRWGVAARTQMCERAGKRMTEAAREPYTGTGVSD